MATNRGRSQRSLITKISSLDAKVDGQGKSTAKPHLFAGDIEEANLAENSVSARSIAVDAIDSTHISRGAVGTENLGVINEINSDGSFVLNVPEGTAFVSGSGLDVQGQIFQNDGERVLSEGDAAGGMPPGTIMLWFSDNIPAAALALEGQTVTGGVNSYPALAAIYPTWASGADLVLPDSRGRVFVGKHAGDSQFDVIGETGGAKTHTLTVAEMPAHSHSQNGNFLTTGTSGTLFSVPSGSFFNFRARSVTNTSGGDDPHNNLQPYMVARYIVWAASSAGDYDPIVQQALVASVTTAQSDIALMKSRPQGVLPSSVAVGSGSATVSADGTVSFTGCTSVSLNNVFDGLGGDIYAFYLTATTSVDLVNILARWRSAAGVDLAADNSYGTSYVGHVNPNASSGSVAGTALNFMYLSYGRTANALFGTANGVISNPGRATFGSSLISTTQAPNYLIYIFSGWSGGAGAVHRGMTFFPSSGTMTGNFKIVKVS